MSTLLVGDIHVVENELDDCRALFDLIYKEATERNIERVVFLGDLTDNFNIINSEVLHFLNAQFYRLAEISKVTALVGNHDAKGANINDIHSLSVFKHLIQVVDGPMAIGHEYVGLPYYTSNEEFLKQADLLYKTNGDKILLCHQSFQGCTYDNGFYDPAGCDLNLVPFSKILVGHIHMPQCVGKAIYIGAPRWRSVSSANVDRHLWLLDNNKVIKIPTGDVCKRIWKYQDQEDSQVDLKDIDTQKDKVIIDIYGTYEYVKSREPYFKSQSCKVNSFPTKEKKIFIRESEGIDKSFQKFADSYKPKNKTPINTLLGMVNARIR